jgi:hypothetical protein
VALVLAQTKEITMIKKVRFNLFDVFFGKGWENWIRMCFHDGEWRHVLGDKKYESGASILLQRKLGGKRENDTRTKEVS